MARPRLVVLFAMAVGAVGLAVVALNLPASPRVGTSPPSGPIGATNGFGVDVSARIAQRPAGGQDVALQAVPAVTLGEMLHDTPARSTPGGASLHSANGDAIFVQAQFAVAIVGHADGPDVPWLRVYALPDVERGPTDFLAWVPAEMVAADGAGECPGSPPSISALAALDPFTRARCLGTASFELTGETWSQLLPVWYPVQPAWLGDQNAPDPRTISIHDGKVDRNPQAGQLGHFLDVQVPPGLAMPPVGFQVAVTVHLADLAAATCSRTPDALAIVPPEAPADSHAWCATRLVVEQWTPLLGPEGRPIDGRSPQLHRHPDWGPNAACAGVGMPGLIFHVDATALDPVTLWTVTGQGPIVASFSPAFRLALQPDPVVVDAAGHVVARNGTTVDPDQRLAGHFICPSGAEVSFN